MCNHLLRVFSVVLCCCLSACGTIQYYSQSIAGQWELVSGKQDISHLIQREDTAPKLKEKLILADQLREFAFTNLDLPDNGSYRSYVDLGRPFVVWNVFATAELSLEPHTSCFPFVGCLSYRGFFSPDAAQEYSASLAARGMDTYVGGVSAYSTLGWFEDPILNTMLNWSDTRLAEVLFHELAHQKLYIPDDTDFNEAFAMVVGSHGVTLWLDTGNNKAQMEQYQLQQQRDDAFINLLLTARERLNVLYKSDTPEQYKRQQKKLIYTTLIQDYQTFKQHWDGYSGYDQWMENDLNNAKLLSVSTYQSLVMGFKHILTDCHTVLSCFYKTVEHLGQLSAKQRRQCLLEKNLEPLSSSTTCTPDIPETPETPTT